MGNMIQYNPDFLYPLNTNNRDETLVIEFAGFIKNISEGILVTMLMDMENWIEKYPGLETFLAMTPIQRYEATARIEPIDFLLSLTNTASQEDVEKDIDKIYPYIQFSLMKSTMFEFALTKMIAEDFVKKVYFIKTGKFSDNEKNYLAEVFKRNIDKIQVVEAYAYQMIKHDPNVTTTFMHDIDEFKDIIKDNEKEQLSTKFFVIRTTIQNSTYDEITKMAVCLEEDKLIDLARHKEAFISWMYPLLFFENSAPDGSGDFEDELPKG